MESFKIVLMIDVVDGFVSSTTVTNIDLDRFCWFLIQAMEAIKTQMDEEKAVNKKLGDGLADVLLNMADDNLEDLNNDCKYHVVNHKSHIIWLIW